MEYESYIFYIDLLGISYLSKENPEGLRRIMKLFHKILYFYLKNNKYIKYSLISDSVFLYIQSKSETKIINSFIIVSNIFRTLLKNHILCRAGCSYGKFTVLKSKLLEYNIFGLPVTEAVQLEKTGKGHRIFISETVYNRILTILNSMNNKDIKEFIENDTNMYNIDIKKIFEKYNNINMVSKYTNYINYIDIYILNWVYIYTKLFYKNGNIVTIESNEYSSHIKKLLYEDNIKIKSIIDNKNNFQFYNIENNNFKEHIKATSSYVDEYFSKIEELSEIKTTLKAIINPDNKISSTTIINSNE